MNKVLTVVIAVFGTVFAQDTQWAADSFSPAPSQVFYLDLDREADQALNGTLGRRFADEYQSADL
jgi:hypothetical protein